MISRGFKAEHLSPEALAELQERSRRARGDILTMTTLAGCGHPGGSMSSIDMYMTLFSCADVHPDQPGHPDRDRIVISHGHTSPGAYAALAHSGFLSSSEAVAGFRFPGTAFEGHVERCVPGIEWGTGNLGQGLSAGCGFALAARLHRKKYRTYVLMGDGEQQKGQISEARRFASKYGLNDLTVLIDNNRLQISGDIKKVMPQNIADNFKSDGWRVLEINGHDFRQIYDALCEAHADLSAPVAIIAGTIMGKGVSFMENIARYHGVALSEAQYADAMKELSLEPSLEDAKMRRAKLSPSASTSLPPRDGSFLQGLETGTPACYEADKKMDNRSAFGNALKNIAEQNKDNPSCPPIAVFDCDLADSVKTSGFKSCMPDRFFEAGIQEHNTATMAGALSSESVVTFFADFGVFGVCETYNQHRLNDINHSNLKLVCTHVGLDVGEDGKTHQCIDYIGLFQNIFGYRVIIPGDPNQTDRVTRYVSKTDGNFFIGMGRSKLPLILDESGRPLFGDGYDFKYGTIDVIRKGDDAAIISCGTMLYRAVQAHDLLKQKGISARILNASCPKDLDSGVIAAAAQTGAIVTYEDHNVHTGLGCAVADNLISQRLATVFKKLGVRSYGLSGPPDDAYKAAGLDVETLVEEVETAVRNK